MAKKRYNPSRKVHKKNSEKLKRMASSFPIDSRSHLHYNSRALQEYMNTTGQLTLPDHNPIRRKRNPRGSTKMKSTLPIIAIIAVVGYLLWRNRQGEGVGYTYRRR